MRCTRRATCGRQGRKGSLARVAQILRPAGERHEESTRSAPSIAEAPGTSHADPCFVTIPSSLSASCLRAQILSQHAAIREILGRLNTDAMDAFRGTESGELAQSLRSFLRTLQDHTAFEEETLVPLLRESDPWGPQRATRLLEEHVRQRAELAAMEREAAAGHTPATLALMTQTLIAEVLADMEHEERNYLVPDVLRDDAVVPDQESG